MTNRTIVREVQTVDNKSVLHCRFGILSFFSRALTVSAAATAAPLHLSSETRLFGASTTTITTDDDDNNNNNNGTTMQ